MAKCKKLVLVNPSPLRTGLSVSANSRFSPLGLVIVASLTPDSWEVELVDENFEAFSFRDADLVGITAFSSAAKRAYEIAGICRAQGVPVVMGGIHASVCPDEALRFVDSVVIGEAESVWQNVLEDVAAGRLQRIYRGSGGQLDNLKTPRRDMLNSGYKFASVQTSRGCPMDCDFCSVTEFNGRRYRRRPPEQVLNELESIPQELLFFVDDNIVGYGSHDRQQALELFQGMANRGLNKQWLCQASLNVADDEELLEWAHRAGCRMIFMGLEAEDDEALAGVNKRLNLSRTASAYAGAFDRIHQAGIAVLGAFIFGLDSDTPEKLYRRTEYMINSGVDAMQGTVLTPLPGTRVFRRLREENRLLHTNFPDDWDRYNMTEVVFQPRNMSVGELTHVLRDCGRRMYDVRVLKEKASRTLKATGRADSTLFAWQANLSYRTIAMAESTYSGSVLDAPVSSPSAAVCLPIAM
jgi:radical SAM superfamily enzyme YgiQ (UPF0313 family)